MRDDLCRIIRDYFQSFGKGCQIIRRAEFLEVVRYFLYPTYDVDQRYRQGNIYDIALWLGQSYHDTALTTTDTWPSGQTQTPHLYVLLY